MVDIISLTCIEEKLMNELCKREFLQQDGISAVELRIGEWMSGYPGFDASFVLHDGQDTASFFWSFSSADGTREVFSDAVRFFDKLRILSEEAIDDLTARWVNMKLGFGSSKIVAKILSR